MVAPYVGLLARRLEIAKATTREVVCTNVAVRWRAMDGIGVPFSTLRRRSPALRFHRRAASSQRAVRPLQALSAIRPICTLPRACYRRKPPPPNRPPPPPPKPPPPPPKPWKLSKPPCQPPRPP